MNTTDVYFTKEQRTYNGVDRTAYICSCGKFTAIADDEAAAVRIARRHNSKDHGNHFFSCV